MIEKRIERIKIESILVASGPYEDNYYNKAIKPLIGKLNSIYDIVKDKEAKSQKEVIEELKALQNF